MKKLLYQQQKKNANPVKYRLMLSKNIILIIHLNIIRNIDIGSNYRIHNFSWSNESLNAKEIIVKVNYHQRQDHLRKKREEYTNLFISTIENKLKEEKNE